MLGVKRASLKALSSQSLTVLLLWCVVMINGCFKRAAFTL